MNVLLMVHDMIYPNRGGGAPRVDAVAKAFVRMGHTPFVFAPVGASVEEAERELGYRVIPAKYIDRKDGQKMFKYAVYSQTLRFKLPDLIRENKIDLVFVHDSIYGYPALIAARKLGKPLVFDATDLIAEYSGFRPVRLFGRMAERRVVRGADRIVTVSQAMKKVLTQMGAQESKVEVVYDGVDRIVFNPRTERNRRDRLTLVYEGGMDPQDGLEILVPAAERVVREIPDARFVLVGDGKVLPEIKEEIKRKGLEQNFVFTGWVRYEDVAEHISNSDVGLVILPDILSARIRVTLKIFEYWACGKPVIAARLDALSEVITEDTGLFYEPGNPVSLAEKIIELYRDRWQREQMGERALMEAEKYRWDALGEKIARAALGAVPSFSAHVSKEAEEYDNYAYGD